MIYSPELQYFFDTADFPFWKVFLVTAEHLSEYAGAYDVHLFDRADVDNPKIAGTLPDDPADRRAKIIGLAQWARDTVKNDGVFAFFLYRAGKDDQKEPALFDHHDDTCCWVLNLREAEFKSLQKAWRKAGLPVDLFYPSDQGHREGGFYYTPKQWELRSAMVVK